jgi:glycerol uptake facilitator-like aquaporin
MAVDLPRRLVAEGLGTLILAATIIGSGAMAERLTDDTALALLGNTLPTGAILLVLMAVLAPVSGANLNPAVTLGLLMRGDMDARSAAAYMLAQIAGAILGALLAHAMFDLPVFQASTMVRSGPSQWLSELVATFGLIFIIFAALRTVPDGIPVFVGLYIIAAYWFTASTSFANPAITIARAFTDTFSGIRPADVPGFIAAQIIGAILAFAAVRWLYANVEE